MTSQVDYSGLIRERAERATRAELGELEAQAEETIRRIIREEIAANSRPASCEIVCTIGGAKYTFIEHDADARTAYEGALQARMAAIEDFNTDRIAKEIQARMDARATEDDEDDEDDPTACAHPHCPFPPAVRDGAVQLWCQHHLQAR